MGQRTLLTIIAIALFGILVVLIVEANEKTPGEQMADSFSEVTEEISDEIDDNTTN